jgi:hypothetical protein
MRVPKLVHDRPQPLNFLPGVTLTNVFCLAAGGSDCVLSARAPANRTVRQREDVA